MGKRKDLDARQKKAIREVVVFELNPEDTPQQTAHANGGDDTDRQELGLKNFTQLI
jgi:hypothetical protein